MSSLNRRYLLVIATVLLTCNPIFAQDSGEKAKKINFGYSKNPPIREVKPNQKESTEINGVIKPVAATKNIEKEESQSVNTDSPKILQIDSNIETVDFENVAENKKKKPANIGKNNDSGAEKIDDTDIDSNPESPVSTELTLAKKTREIAKRAANINVPLTDIYRIGFSDVLFISMQSGETNASKYYTVLGDGTIDYPLAGELISVSGMTTDDVEDLLREKIKLYENPDVTVKVREHASHKIKVIGLVEKPGEKMLQREAIPLYLIKAEAIVESDADQVTVRRKEFEETISLADEKRDGYLILPGDIVEFGNSLANANSGGNTGFFYIGAFVRRFGKNDFSQGMTLTQAIMASGGLRSEGTKKILVRRKNNEGLLETEEYDLKEIKNGKKPDPVLKAGDLIEEGR